MKKISIVPRFAVMLLMALFVAPAQAAWQINMTQGVTDMTHEVWHLHMLIFWICVVIGIGVFGMMLYSVIRHRKSRGHEAANFHENTAIEIIWTVIPFVILIAVAIPAAGTLLKVEDSSHPDMTIRVTGYQWLWEYKYVDSGIHFYSRLSDSSMRARALESVSPYDVDHYLRSVTNRVIVPVHKKVRLLLTSGDVIHSWWVPELAGKKDAIPGYINDIWFNANKTGVYRGQCAELCGRGHGYMPIVVQVVTQEQFKQWVAKKTGGQSGSAQDAAAQSSEQGASSQATGGSADQNGKAASANQGQKQASTKPADNTSTGSSSSAQQASSGATDSASDGNAQPASGNATSPAANDDSKQSNGKQAASDSSAKLSKNKLMALGEKVYGRVCAACHQADGSGLPAAGFPALTGDSVVNGPVDAHIEQVLNGSGAMPPFAGSLSNKEIAAVATYERNALGNSTGDVVQPSDVASLR